MLVGGSDRIDGRLIQSPILDDTRKAGLVVLLEGRYVDIGGRIGKFGKSDVAEIGQPRRGGGVGIGVRDIDLYLHLELIFVAVFQLLFIFLILVGGAFLV